MNVDSKINKGGPIDNGWYIIHSEVPRTGKTSKQVIFSKNPIYVYTNYQEYKDKCNELGISPYSEESIEG